jgi:hypothetical protein
MYAANNLRPHLSQRAQSHGHTVVVNAGIRVGRLDLR